MFAGKDVRVDDSVRLPPAASVGNHSAIDYGTYCTTRFRIADYVHVGPHCSIIGGQDAYFTMWNFTFLAAGCRIICASDEHLGEGIGIPWIQSEHRDKVINKPVVVENFAGVCTGAIILPGVTVKEGSIVGAGCIVREDTEPWTIYIPGMGGSPIPVKIRPNEKIIQSAKELGYDFSS